MLEPVIADREKIGQVLTNIIINAIKYSPVGGEILIKADPIEGGVEVSVRTRALVYPVKWLDKDF